ncbi:hypothetical protein, partial [Burkholderia metallica]|uniref:hypothetical protein n=1 Tax=Burkholderia metallica TaxID=488729 RepID=UPI001CF2E2B8
DLPRWEQSAARTEIESRLSAMPADEQRTVLMHLNSKLSGRASIAKPAIIQRWADAITVDRAIEGRDLRTNRERELQDAIANSPAQLIELDTPRSPQSATNQDPSPQQARRPVAISPHMANFPARAGDTSRASVLGSAPLNAQQGTTSVVTRLNSASGHRAGSPTDLVLSFPATSVRSVHNLDTVMDDEPYKKPIMPLLPYSQKFLERYPACRAYGAYDVFVSGPDGKVRRFPVDGGTNYSVYGGRDDRIPESIGRTFSMQTHVIYDAHRDEIHQAIAEYWVNPSSATMEFKVNGLSVQSISSTHAIYPLPGGKWMVPQPKFRDCTFACEEMLLAEGKPAHQVSEQTRNFRSHGYRRTLDEQCQSLQARSGCTPMVVKGDGISSAASLKELQSSIAKYGPGILDMNGHARIIDSIEEGEDGHLLTMRDPFSASFLKIKNHESFWVNQMDTQKTTSGPESPRYWAAIFLPK